MKKILVVDDEEDILLILKTGLERKGYAVTTAESATLALGILRNEKFPVVLSDIMMPGVDGLKFLKMVKRDSLDIIVIMLSAFISVESAKTALNEGAFAYLNKPIQFEELYKTLERAFDKHDFIEKNKKLAEELKEAKEFDEAVIENLYYMVIATDPEGLIRKVNKAVEEMLGYNAQELIGFPLPVIFSKSFQNTDWPELIRQGQVKDYPVVFISREGKELRAAFSGSVLKNSKGRALGFLGTAKIM